MRQSAIVSVALGLVTAVLVAPAWGGICGGAILCGCGDTVTGTHTLTTDPVVYEPCDGNGLIVAGAHLDLGGKTITGTKRGVGLLLQGHWGSISGGRVTNFDIGILSDEALDGWGLRHLIVTLNRVGIRLDADDTGIMESRVTSNQEDGVFLSGSASSVVGNTCSFNGGRGLVVRGPDNRISGNRCERNSGDGIRVEGATTGVFRNLSSGNRGSGLVAVGDVGLSRNQARTNAGDGVRGIGGPFSDGRNYGTGNRGANCAIDGVSTTRGRYC
jgi:hypothetical protein